MIIPEGGIDLPSRRNVDVGRFLHRFPFANTFAQTLFTPIFEYYSCGHVQYFPHNKWMEYNLRSPYHPIGNTSELAAVHAADDCSITLGVTKEDQVKFDTDFFLHSKRCSVKTALIDSKDQVISYSLHIHHAIMTSLSDLVWFVDNQDNTFICVPTQELRRNLKYSKVVPGTERVLLKIGRIPAIKQGKVYSTL